MVPPSNSPEFPSTNWQILKESRGDDTRAGQALASLCQAYWYPVYCYTRGLGLDPSSAEDATQGFFAKLIESGTLDSVRPESGKLRSYIKTCVKNQVFQMERRKRAKKHGGDYEMVSFDQDAYESRYLNDISDGETPEHAFDRRWACAILGKAVAQLRAHYHQRDDAQTFEILYPLIVDSERGSDYQSAAHTLGMSEGTVRVKIHRLRKRLREVLCDEISKTLNDFAEVDQEIDLLFATVTR